MGELIPITGPKKEELAQLDLEEDKLILTNKDIKLSDGREISVDQFLREDRARAGVKAACLQFALFLKLDKLGDFRIYSNARLRYDSALKKVMQKEKESGVVLVDDAAGTVLVEARILMDSFVFVRAFILARSTDLPNEVAMFINNQFFLVIPEHYFTDDEDVTKYIPFIDKKAFNEVKEMYAHEVERLSN